MFIVTEYAALSTMVHPSNVMLDKYMYCTTIFNWGMTKTFLSCIVNPLYSGNTKMSTFAKSEDPDEMPQDEIWAKIHHNGNTELWPI